MKLRNKKTGEIGEPAYFDSKMYILIDNELKTNLNYNSLAELNEEWEDYEEPKEYWYIDCYGDVQAMCGEDKTDIICRKQIGNYFETKEEAEKAVEKLKTWKRLKDKGFKFTDWDCSIQGITFEVPESFYDKEGLKGVVISDKTRADLDLLFGGENDDEDEDMPTNAEINDLTDIGY